MPEALEATLHPNATRAVAIMLFHNVVGTREAGRVMPQCVMPFAGASPPITGVAHRMEALPRVAVSLRVTLDDLHEAVTTLVETIQTARQVLGGAHPTTKSIERSLQRARAVLRARA